MVFTYLKRKFGRGAGDDDGTAAPDTAAGTAPAGAPAAAAPDDASATSLETVQQTAPGLVSLYKTAKVSLQKHQVDGVRAAVYLVLDRSGSMRDYYRNGSVQRLAEQALGLAAHFDDDGIVPVVFFSTQIDGVHDISLADHTGRIGALHQSMGHMGRTNYAAAIEAVVKHYKGCGATDPAFVIFQTDGGPSDKRAAERALCAASGLPIFWKFIGFGPDRFDFLRKLDDLPVPATRKVDNADFFAAGSTPLAMPDSELYDRLMNEFPQWLATVRREGILH